MHIDRRLIYALLFAVVLAPFLLQWKQPPQYINPWTQSLYDYIEKLPPGTPVLVSFDFDPAVKPELYPMAMAITRHLHRRNARVIGMTMLPSGVLMVDDVLNQTGEEAGKRRGEDWVNLGYKTGGLAVILGLGENLKRVFPTDAHLASTAPLPVLRGVRNYQDIGLLITISGTGMPGAWIAFAHQRYKVPVAVGTTSVQATDYYVYLRTGQIVGMLNGIAAAAEYEKLIGVPDQAMLGMPGVTACHLLMVLLVIVGNVAYFASRRHREEPTAEPPEPPTGEEV
ncbi:MAG TPA: hypothetical protein VGM19_04545 [Armatimonadota bacterium]